MEGFALKHGVLIFLLVALMLVSPSENHQYDVAGTPAPAPLAPSKNLPTTTMPHGTTEGSLKPQECGPRCATRCSQTQYRKPCLFFCNKCCAKCLCVPAGFYGNKQVCPCYNNWKTKRGGPKCP